MADKYLRSTDGSDSDNGTTWALAKALASAVAGVASAGDRIFVSQVHSSTETATIALPGTLASPNQLLCGNDGAEPPTAMATTAAITTASTNNLIVTGSAYIDGIVFTAGDAAANFTNMKLNTSGAHRQHYKNCDLILRDQHPSSTIYVGSFTGGDSCATKVENSRIKFGNTGQWVTMNHIVHLKNVSVISGGSTPASGAFTGGNTGIPCLALIENCDFSNWSSTVNLIAAPTNTRVADIAFERCRLPASWSGDLFATLPTSLAFKARLINCAAGSTQYPYWERGYAGDVKHDATVYRSSGSTQDGSTGYSMKLTTTANTKYPTTLLQHSIKKWNSTTGSAITAEVEFVHDQQGAGSGSKVQNDEWWAEFDYVTTTSTVNIGTVASSAKADVLTAAANHADSSVTWTGAPGTPVKQKFQSGSFTPQAAGYIVCKIYGAKASKTIYVCQKMTVA